MAKAAADATVPEDSEGYSREKWFIARDAALFARQALMPTPAAGDVEAVARKMAAGEGLIYDEVCGYDTDAEECNSNTCIAAHFEDHDSDVARAMYDRLARAAIAAMQSRSAEPLSGAQQLPIMRTAFRTTLSGSGKYSMQFEFRDLATLHSADYEWLNFRKEIECSIGAAAAGVTSTAAISTDPAEPAGEEPVAYHYKVREYGKVVSYSFEYAENRRSELRANETETPLYAHPATPTNPERLVVENTDGEFVASFATKLLADFFVEDGGGCYRHRAAPVNDRGEGG
ncbi:hypothetical protein ADT71_19945 [Novosphingobium sp. ST904]|nr:hypothetical protein ADT71_19945 [Novosphingobium sp. ST904]